MFPVPDKGFEEVNIDFTSKYARDLIAEELPKKEFTALKSRVKAATADDEFGAKVVSESAGQFETVAHKTTIGGAAGQTEFSMRILTSANNITESEFEGNCWRFNFSKEKSFKGKRFPDTLETGTYYTPENKNFAAIDSFGVESGSNTLWFFQGKSRGLMESCRTVLEQC